jgi:membrane-associated phospholipid phosphatase
MTDGTTLQRYDLRGPQIEPDASYWMYCARLRLLNIEELTAIADRAPTPGNPNACYFPPYNPDHTVELAQLKALEQVRDDPDGLRPDSIPGPLAQRQPISRLWNLMPPPMGAALATRLPNERQIRTGRGLARAVESETPGLFHRHVLNFLVRLRPDWSPPRQALVWAGLDVTMASALEAAWYYKWLAEDPPTAFANGSNLPVKRDPAQGLQTSFRPRPVEVDSSLTVLFDNPDELNPVPIECPLNQPGTPRHPAYPSGHSTYAGAASEYLNFFFGELGTPPSLLATERAPGSPQVTTLEQEFDFLADNIGMGRLWAGIHWLSDHTNGLLLGRVVARLVLKQMMEMMDHVPNAKAKLCVVPMPCNLDQPPADLHDRAEAFRDACQPATRPSELPEPATECPPTPPSCPAPVFAFTGDISRNEFDRERRLLELSRSPQQGGGLPIDELRPRTVDKRERE